MTFLEKSKLLVAHIHYYNESNGKKGLLSGSEENHIWQLAEKASETQGLNNHAKIFNLGTLLFADLQTKYLITKLSYAELEKVSLVISTNSLGHGFEYELISLSSSAGSKNLIHREVGCYNAFLWAKDWAVFTR